MSSLWFVLLGLIAGISLAWVIWKICSNNGWWPSAASDDGATESLLDQVEDRLSGIREDAEQAEARIARLREIRRQREAQAGHRHEQEETE